MKGTYIFLAPGFEPLEALAPMDILRRGGVQAQFVSTDEDYFAESTQGYSIVTDLCWEDFLDESQTEGIECMIFPGGLPGADNLGGNSQLMEIARNHYDEGGLTCAICAAPARTIAANLDVKGRHMTAYEGFEGELEAAGAIVGQAVAATGVAGNAVTSSDGLESGQNKVGDNAADSAVGKDKVVIDRNLITAKGPGLAIDFGFAILTALRGPEVCTQVRKGMML